MPELSKINIGGVEYDIKDTTARAKNGGGTGGSGLFLVSVTHKGADNFVSDKTYGELAEAMAEEKPVLGIFTDTETGVTEQLHAELHADDGELHFLSAQGGYVLYADGSWEYDPALGSGGAVLYTEQALTPKQKEQARANIGAAEAEDNILEVNPNNLLVNPLINGTSGWIMDAGAEMVIVETDTPANGVKLVNPGNAGLTQHLNNLREMTSGHYVARYRLFSGDRYCNFTIQVIGNGETKVLASGHKQTPDGAELEFDLDIAQILMEVPSAYRLKVRIGLGDYTEVVVSEVFLGLDEGGNTNFWLGKDDVDYSKVMNPLYGKKIALNGDSICYGDGDVGGYGKYLVINNNAEVQNIAIPGATIISGTTGSDGSNRHWICRTIADMDANADYAILQGGVNDAAMKAPMGAITEGYNAVLDDTTFYGAFESMLKQLVIRFAGKKIGYIAVHKMTTDFRSDNEPGTSYYWAAKKCCEKWGVPFLDLNTMVPPFNYFRDGGDSELDAMRLAYTKDGDGWHPNRAGYRSYYVPKIEAWMRTL